MQQILLPFGCGTETDHRHRRVQSLHHRLQRTLQEVSDAVLGSAPTDRSSFQPVSCLPQLLKARAMEYVSRGRRVLIVGEVHERV